MSEYDDAFISGLEWMWGEGFMSPGGSAEIATLLEGIDLKGKHVLDIGCGIGGIDILLVEKYGAATVIGIDVKPSLLAHANTSIAKAGLSAQITTQLVEPGPLPFDDATFDIVFSKDAIIHIPDKRAIYADMYRVLKHGGHVAFSDWFGSDLPKTPDYNEWVDVVGITLEMGLIEDAAALITSVGFSNVNHQDRNEWYAQNILEELATLQGENYAKYEAALGKEAAAQRLKSSSLKKRVVDQGLLRPGHIRAQKPLSPA